MTRRESSLRKERPQARRRAKAKDTRHPKDTEHNKRHVTRRTGIALPCALQHCDQKRDFPLCGQRGPFLDISTSKADSKIPPGKSRPDTPLSSPSWVVAPYLSLGCLAMRTLLGCKKKAGSRRPGNACCCRAVVS